MERIDAILQVGRSEWLAFDTPARIIAATSPHDVRAAIAETERLTRDAGLHAVGFVTYEAAAAFGLRVRPPSEDWPLVWFGLFDRAHVAVVDRPVRDGRYRLASLEPTIDRHGFSRAFARIKSHLAAGDSYQVNFTFKMTGAFEGEPLSLFADLVEAQGGSYSAFIRIGDRVICSASPERFFSFQGAEIQAQPMKGTARRGRTPAEDRRQRDELHASAKQRAENVMIVDMIRNDLGRIAAVGSIEVPDLFAVERYPNVWQMTSLVTGRSVAPLEDVFAAVHPSASVTGAPKVRTMEILSELEDGPRGVYTGAIGHIPPDGNARFNVAIRTAILDCRRQTVEFGIGSGIVWDSDAADEYDECLLKGSVLGRPPDRFELLETLRWTPGHGFLLLERHLDRLRESAEYFDFACDLDQVRSALDVAASQADGVLRVRLLVSKDGGVRVEHAALSSAPTPLRVTLAVSPVDSADVWLFHKTTNRRVYEEARAEARQFDEVILWNERGEITEATTANVVAEIGGRKVTPPVECGLLAGTYRAELLATGGLTEGVIHVQDLRSASRIWLINSVHESRDAELAT